MGQIAKKRREFEALTRQYSTDVFRFAYWLCNDRSMAEDLVQETFLRAWRAFDSLQDNAKAKSWLITIVRREHARFYERKRLEMTDVEPESVASSNQDYDTSADAFVLRQALEKLDDDYREPLIMQVIGGYSCDEIAAEMGLTRGAVTTRLFRAKQKLREALGPRELTDED